jgi:hypothetical protein
VLGQEPWPPAERVERLGEFVDVLDRLVVDGSLTTIAIDGSGVFLGGTGDDPYEGVHLASERTCDMAATTSAALVNGMA